MGEVILIEFQRCPKVLMQGMTLNCHHLRFYPMFVAWYSENWVVVRSHLKMVVQFGFNWFTICYHYYYHILPLLVVSPTWSQNHQTSKLWFLALKARSVKLLEGSWAKWDDETIAIQYHNRILKIWYIYIYPYDILSICICSVRVPILYYILSICSIRINQSIYIYMYVYIHSIYLYNMWI